MTSSSDTERNVRQWTQVNAEHTDAAADRQWARDEITWGSWRVPESELGVLGDVEGVDVVELGCWTAYFSAWLRGSGFDLERLVEIQAPEGAGGQRGLLRVRDHRLGPAVAVGRDLGGAQAGVSGAWPWAYRVPDFSLARTR